MNRHNSQKLSGDNFTTQRSTSMTVPEGSAFITHTIFRPIKLRGAVEKRRPGAAARDRLLDSKEGRALIGDVRKSLSSILNADGLAPLSALRLARNMSEAELAARSGIQQPQLSRIASGAHPDILASTLQRIALALEMSLDEVNASIAEARRRRAK